MLADYSTHTKSADPQTGAVQRVLVVDDSRLQRKIVSSALKKWGFDVAEAESGHDALNLCKSYVPDLVISDWMMPGMDGLEFCRAFRGLPTDRYGYFILLTSKSEKNEVARGLDAGADDFLTKPVNSHELRARIAAGDRILRMERELKGKNRLISETLTELQTLYDSLDRDLVEAKKLQQSLIRDRFKSFEGADLSLLLRSCGHVGGDLVGFYPAGQDQLGLFAIDVSGHGISSALMTARLAGYLSSALPDQNIALGVDPEGKTIARPTAEVIQNLNNLVLNEMDTEHYFTLLLAHIDLSSGVVEIGQAGQPHPLIQRANGKIEQAGPGGFPVGLLPDAEFSQYSLHLKQGDRLLILSDGVTECPDPAGNLLGEAGLEKMIQNLATAKGPALLEALIWTLSDYAGGRAFPDDVSAILFEFGAAVK
jgi:phosphoserine phosphatase RsbU/P